MSLTAPQIRIAVIGGGLSGLVAAHRLNELAQARGAKIEVTLFESGPRLGGVIGTERIGNYLVDTGADSFITNKPAAVNLCRRLGIDHRLVATAEQFRGALVLYDGRPYPVPEGFQLMSPTAIWPMLVSPILSPWGKLRMAMEYFVPRSTSANAATSNRPEDLPDESLASFVRRRFGKEALERLVQPLVGGIYTSDPEKLSIAATMPRFLEMERDYGSLLVATLFSKEAASARRQSQRGKAPASTSGSPAEAIDVKSSGARYGLFAGLAGGMEDMLSVLRQRATATCHVHLNTSVSQIDEREPSAGSSRFQITLTNDNTKHDFDAVIVAIPSYRAATLLEGIDLELARSLNEIEYASSAIVVTGHRLSDVAHPLNAFGLVIPQRERRQILAVSFSSRKFPDRAPQDSVLLRTFVGGALQPELLNRSDEELVELVRTELAALLGVRGSPDFAKVCRYPHAMPQYHVGHLPRLAIIEARLGRHRGLELAGNAYRGVGIPDVVANAESAAEKLINQLG